MSTPLMLLVMAVYAAVALDKILRKDFGMALVFGSYALSLVGFLMLEAK